MSTYAKATESWRCDDCGAEMVMPLFCDGCGVEYPERKRMSAFGLLGLSQSYAVDLDELELREVKIARRLHPDRWQSRGERLYRRALVAQSAINESLELLRDPFVRASSLLSLRCGDGTTDAVETRLPQSFLIEQLELQEEIEEGLPAPRKREVKKQVRGELATLQETILRAFEKLEAELSDDEQQAACETVRDAVARSRYWSNARTALRGQGPAL